MFYVFHRRKNDKIVRPCKFVARPVAVRAVLEYAPERERGFYRFFFGRPLFWPFDGAFTRTAPVYVRSRRAHADTQNTAMQLRRPWNGRAVWIFRRVLCTASPRPRRDVRAPQSRDARSGRRKTRSPENRRFRWPSKNRQCETAIGSMRFYAEVCKSGCYFKIILKTILTVFKFRVDIFTRHLKYSYRNGYSGRKSI